MHNARVVVRGEVVHDEDIVTMEFGEELPSEPGDKPVLVRGSEHRGEQDPSSQADGAEQGQILAPVHRSALNVLLTALHPGVTSGHRSVEPRLVEEDELVWGDAANSPPEDLSLVDDVRAQLLQRTQPFFLTTYPARWSARLMLEAWRRFLPRRFRLYAAVISPAFASRRRETSASSSSSEMSDGLPPLFALGRRWP